VTFVQAPAPPQALRKALEGLDAELIMHARTRKVHRASLDEEAADKGLWAAPCGWRYGGTSFFRLTEQPPGADLCRRCFPETATLHVSSSAESSSKASTNSSSRSSSD
jgi:hypothetical protein